MVMQIMKKYRCICKDRSISIDGLMMKSAWMTQMMDTEIDKSKILSFKQRHYR